MNPEFEYILTKISDAKIINDPFPHLDIKNFLSEEHLDLIIKDNQIHFEKLEEHDKLYDTLIANGWTIQDFPGCINNWKEYKEFLENHKTYTSTSPVETVGITFRLKTYRNKKIQDLINFMNSTAFHEVLRKKFNIIGKILY